MLVEAAIGRNLAIKNVRTQRICDSPTFSYLVFEYKYRGKRNAIAVIHIYLLKKKTKKNLAFQMDFRISVLPIHMFLVGGWATPLKNRSSSIGMMRFPRYGKIENVPNHQPAFNLIHSHIDVEKPLPSQASHSPGQVSLFAS